MANDLNGTKPPKMAILVFDVNKDLKNWHNIEITLFKLRNPLNVEIGVEAKAHLIIKTRSVTVTFPFTLNASVG